MWKNVSKETNQIKKWTEDEVIKIINYLRETPEIDVRKLCTQKAWNNVSAVAAIFICFFLILLLYCQASTTQIFYKKLIERCSIRATWDLIRFKIRHLKVSVKKANDWEKSTGMGLIEPDSRTGTAEGKWNILTHWEMVFNPYIYKVLQMCPYYNRLNEIFDEKEI